MESNVAVKVDNVSKIYKLYDKPMDRMKEAINPFKKNYHQDFYALKEISFAIKKGETVGIVGKNGSGKSTLLQIITGVLKPSSGKVHVNGRISALLELGAGFNPELTGLENIYLNGTIMGFSKVEMESRVDDIIAFADIGNFIYQPLKMYSSGMFVRLAFACAVNIDPDILVIDEALAVGDMQFQLKCIDKMKSFKKEGKTIFFVSHDTYSIKNFCNQVMWLDSGQVHIRGHVFDVIERYEDFMKKSLENNKETISQEKDMDILSIDEVTFRNSSGSEKSVFGYGESIDVIVKYTLKSRMKGIVGGIALFDKQNTYVCGLNTKLDSFNLPDEPGTYTVSLSYSDVRLLAGTYCVDVGFFESSGIVQLDYKSKAAYFTINSGDYFAEGLTYINHLWKCKEH